MQIDLNSDLGEGFGPWAMGDDAAMLGIVTSANIACGGHASDPETMYATLVQAGRRGVVVGAHPGYADRIGFGRRVIPMETGEIARMMLAQIGALRELGRLAGVPVAYVKPHGALANHLAARRDVSDGVAAALAAACPDLAVLAISGTAFEGAARAAGLRVYSEIFADRGYRPDGQLVPRGSSGAMIEDPGAALARVLAFLDSGRMPVVGGDPIPLAAQSLCVHGDSAHAVAMAGTLRQGLTAAGVRIAPFLA